MKSLSIEELKALEVGDWVWIIDTERDERFYGCKDEECGIRVVGENSGEEFAYTSADEFGAFDYSDYGKTWLAYKNKEQAEGVYDKLEAECDDKENYTIELYGRLREVEHELKEMKTRIEKGEIVELPCKVGDKFYGFPNKIDAPNQYFNYTVKGIEYCQEGVYLRTNYDMRFKYGVEAFMTEPKPNVVLPN